MADKDPNEMAAEKLNKEIKKVQAQQRKQFDMPRKNIPLNDDMGPTNPGVEMLKGAMEAEEAAKQRAAMERAMLKGAGMGGMGQMQGMKKGGKVKKYCRGGGIEVRGKTKGRMV